jgi:hypothetical protein
MVRWMRLRGALVVPEGGCWMGESLCGHCFERGVRR